MAQTSSAKTRIKTIRDELTSAVGKADDKAKAAVRNAIERLDEVNKEIQQELKYDVGEDRKDRDAALRNLQETAARAKTVLNQKGAELHAEIKKIADSVETALKNV